MRFKFTFEPQSQFLKIHILLTIRNLEKLAKRYFTDAALGFARMDPDGFILNARPFPKKIEQITIEDLVAHRMLGKSGASFDLLLDQIIQLNGPIFKNKPKNQIMRTKLFEGKKEYCIIPAYGMVHNLNGHPTFYTSETFFIAERWERGRKPELSKHHPRWSKFFLDLITERA